MALFGNEFRRDVRDAEAAIVKLNRQVTEAIATGHRPDALQAKIRSISESRNFVLARLRRIDEAEMRVKRVIENWTLH